MNRRFVNLLVSKIRGRGRNRSPAFNLHRIDPANLFCPAGSRKPLSPTAIVQKARLPPPAISFDWPCPLNQTGWMDFMSLKDDIIAVDHEGRTLLYDGAVRTLKPTRDPRYNTIYVTTGDGLYVMATDPGPPPQSHYFQALSLKSWDWRRLQPLPFDILDIDNDPTYFEYELGPAEAEDPYAFGAYTVVGDSKIWISTVGAGTYSFDTSYTASGKWSRIGDWALPFRGRAEYVPEHNLWFGFSDKDEHLCSADLAQQPAAHLRDFPLRQLWDDQYPSLPEAWTQTATRLVPLGSGKLCVARFFRGTKGEKLLVPDHRHENVGSFAVLAGVEIIKDPAGTGSLKLIEHKSVCYSVGEGVFKPL